MFYVYVLFRGQVQVRAIKAAFHTGRKRSDETRAKIKIARARQSARDAARKAEPIIPDLY